MKKLISLLLCAALLLSAAGAGLTALAAIDSATGTVGMINRRAYNPEFSMHATVTYSHTPISDLADYDNDYYRFIENRVLDYGWDHAWDAMTPDAVGAVASPGDYVTYTVTPAAGYQVNTVATRHLMSYEVAFCQADYTLQPNIEADIVSTDPATGAVTFGFTMPDYWVFIDSNVQWIDDNQPRQYFIVTSENHWNGNVTPDCRLAYAGDTVSLTLEPSMAHTIEYLYGMEPSELTYQDTTHCTFTMPDHDVYLCYNFKYQNGIYYWHHGEGEILFTYTQADLALNDGTPRPETGSTVTVRFEPEQGGELLSFSSNLHVGDDDHGDQILDDFPLTDLGNNTYSFVMPEFDVIIEATFSRPNFFAAMSPQNCSLSFTPTVQGITGQPISAFTGTDAFQGVMGTRAFAGTTVTYTVTPDQGYTVDLQTCAQVYSVGALYPDLDIDDGGPHLTASVQSTDSSTGAVTFSFVMPDYTVAIMPAAISDGAYQVTVQRCYGGSITTDHSTAYPGDTVTLTLTPESGHVLEELYVTDGYGDLTLTTVDDTHYTFEMRDSDVYISGGFKWNHRVYTSDEGAGHTAVTSYTQVPDYFNDGSVQPVPGTTVTVQCTPEPGAELLSFGVYIYYWGEWLEDHDPIPLQYETTDGYTYTFTMPEHDQVAVFAEYTRMSFFASLTPSNCSVSFTPVVEGVTGEPISTFTGTDAFPGIMGTRAFPGTTVTYTVTPDADYEVDVATCSQVYSVGALYPDQGIDDGGPHLTASVQSTDSSTGAVTFSFVMPDYTVAIMPTATFAGIDPFAVIIDPAIENGEVLSDYEAAYQGEVITLTATPDSGYELEALTVTGVNTNAAITLTDLGDGDYAFEMPEDDVFVTATYVAQQEENGIFVPIIKYFQDVDWDTPPGEDWFLGGGETRYIYAPVGSEYIVNFDEFDVEDNYTLDREISTASIPSIAGDGSSAIYLYYTRDIVIGTIDGVSDYYYVGTRLPTPTVQNPDPGLFYIGWEMGSGDENWGEVLPWQIFAPDVDFWLIPLSMPLAFTLHFIDMNDEYIDDDRAVYGDEIVTPEAPEIRGFIFTGCWVDAETGDPMPATVPARNATYKAVYIARDDLYAVIIDPAIENGEVYSDYEAAYVGETVTLTVTPEVGYALDMLTVTCESDSSPVELTAVDDNTYTFVMPADDVIVTASFTSAGAPVSRSHNIYLVRESEEGPLRTSADRATAVGGETVTVTAIAEDEGYWMFGIRAVADGYFAAIPFSCTDGVHYSFTMPADTFEYGDVTVYYSYTRPNYVLMMPTYHSQAEDHYTISFTPLSMISGRVYSEVIGIDFDLGTCGTCANAGTTVFYTITPDPGYALDPDSVTSFINLYEYLGYDVSQFDVDFPVLTPQLVSEENGAYTYSVYLPQTSETELFYGLIPVVTEQTPVPEDPNIVVGTSLTLNGTIGVNVYVRPNAATEDGGYMTITGPNDFSQTAYFEDMTITENGYKISATAYSTQMTQPVTVCVYNAAGEQQDLYCRGILQPDQQYVTSVASYAELARTSEAASSELRALADCIYNYGAYAQIHFDEYLDMETDSDAIAGVTAETVADYAAVITGTQPAGFSFVGYSLLLKDVTSLRLYFDMQGEMPAITVDGEPYEVRTREGLYYVEISNIPSPRLDQTHTIAIGDYQFTISALSYVYHILSNYPDRTNLANTMRALYLYHIAAVDLFRSLGMLN